MKLGDVNLFWTDINIIEKGYKVYRSETPIDVNTPPAPLTTLKPGAEHYLDKDLPIGDVYYYRTSAFIDGAEQFSREVMVKVKDAFNIYTASMDNTALSLNNAGLVNWTSTVHTAGVNDVCADSSNMTFTASADGSVVMYSPQGDAMWTYKGHNRRVSAVAVDNHGFVYSADNISNIKKLDYEGNVIWSIRPHSGDATSVYCDYGNLIYAANDQRELARIDKDGNVVLTKTFSNIITSISSHLSTGELVVGFDNGEVSMLDAELNVKWTFTGHTSSIVGLSCDPTEQITSASDDGVVKKISIDGTEIWSVTHDASVTALKTNEYGDVYGGDVNGTAFMIDNDGVLQWSNALHANAINSVNVTKKVQNVEVLWSPRFGRYIESYIDEYQLVVIEADDADDVASIRPLFMKPLHGSAHLRETYVDSNDFVVLPSDTGELFMKPLHGGAHLRETYIDNNDFVVLSSDSGELLMKPLHGGAHLRESYVDSNDFVALQSDTVLEI